MIYGILNFHLALPLDVHLLAQAAEPEAAKGCLQSVFKASESVALSCGVSMSQENAAAWDAIWNLKIGEASPEFLSAMNISRYIAGPAVVLWAVAGLKGFMRNQLSETWPQFLIAAVLVGVLYGNQASMVRSTVMATRALINWNNNQILELANAGNRYENKLTELADFTLVDNEITQYREQCNGLTNNQAMLDCLERAEQLADAALEDYIELHGETRFTIALRNVTKNLIQDPKEFVAGVIAEGGAVGAGAAVGGPVGAAVVGGVILLGKVANSATGLIAEGSLAYMTSLVQNIIEGAWLFTAVIVPVPLALAFYPGTRGVLTGWVIGFLSLGLFKMNLNLASSLIVAMLYERGPGEPVLDLALLSLGVVVLAFSMTAGGGMAIFSALTSVISGVTLGIVNISSPGAGGK